MGARCGSGRRLRAKRGSYLRLVDSCITQLKAQGPSRTCNDSKKEEEGKRGHPKTLPESHSQYRVLTVLCVPCSLDSGGRFRGGLVFKAHRRVYHSTLGLRVIQKRKKMG